METILLFAPFIGALLAGFGWRWFGEQLACIIATALLFLSMILSWAVFIGFDGETYSISILRWVESGSLFTDWAIRVDRLTAIMLIVITSVSALVHLIPLATWRMTTISAKAKAIARGSLPICRSSPLPC